MSGKDKLRKFRENEGFRCLVQPENSELIDKGADGGFSLGNFRYKGCWNRNFFGNDNPVVLEIGCGKGEYTLELARRNPQMNFIGIDIKGARLWRGAKTATDEGISNAAFIRTRIEFIEALFAPGEVSQIWITFADPQIGRERHRLTAPVFLERFRNIMKPDGLMRLKTDSKYLFHYTLDLVNLNGLPQGVCCKDVYAFEPVVERGSLDPIVTQVQTFYEKHYIKNGLTIHYLEFGLWPATSSPREIEKILSPEWDEVYWERVELEGRARVVSNKGC